METYAALDDIIRDDARAVGIVKNVRVMFQRVDRRAQNWSGPGKLGRGWHERGVPAPGET